MAIRMTPEGGIQRYDQEAKHHLCTVALFDLLTQEWDFKNCPDDLLQADPAQLCIGCHFQTDMARPKPEKPGERRAWREVKTGKNNVKTKTGAGFSIPDWDA